MKKYILASCFLTSFLFLGGCSSSPKKVQSENPSQKSVEATEVEASDDANRPGALTKVQTSKAVRVSFNANELIAKVSEYIAQNPESPLKKVAEYANQLKNEIGLPFTLVVPNAEIIGTETFITAEDGTRLNVGIGSEPLCSSGVAVTYPVLRREGDSWIVRYNSGQYKIKASPLRTGDIRREKDGKLEAKVAMTEEGAEPGGISKNGERVLVRFDLNPATSSWWLRVMKRNPKEENPFLIIEMGDSDFEFSNDLDNYDGFDESPPREAKEDETYILRFEDSKFYFQSVSCG